MRYDVFDCCARATDGSKVSAEPQQRAMKTRRLMFAAFEKRIAIPIENKLLASISAAGWISQRVRAKRDPLARNDVESRIVS